MSGLPVSAALRGAAERLLDLLRLAGLPLQIAMLLNVGLSPWLIGVYTGMLDHAATFWPEGTFADYFRVAPRIENWARTVFYVMLVTATLRYLTVLVEGRAGRVFGTYVRAADCVLTLSTATYLILMALLLAQVTAPQHRTELFWYLCLVPLCSFAVNGYRCYPARVRARLAAKPGMRTCPGGQHDTRKCWP